jgi:glycerophosphoryl diester phosphodiesterase
MVDYQLTDIISLIEPAACAYECQGETLCVYSRANVNDGVSSIRIPIPAFCDYDLVVVSGTVQNLAGGFGTCFVGIDVADEHDREPGGQCQFYGAGRRQYQYKFIIPANRKSAAIVITCRNGGSMRIHRLNVYTVKNVPTVLPLTVGGPKFVAHLGMTGYAPPNTMPGFCLAKHAGYRECVTNTNYTKDGYLVALHNNTIDATSTGSGCIHDMTLAEARRYDYGVRFGNLYPDTELPLLEDVLKTMSKSGMRPVLRLGGCFLGDKRHYLEEMYAMVKQLGMSGRCTAKAFDMPLLDELSRIAGDDFRYGYCCGAKTPVNEDCIRHMSTLGSDVYIDVRYTAVTPEIVAAARRFHVATEAWIINDFEAIVKLSEMGVTGFTTDFYPLDGCLY